MTLLRKDGSMDIEHINKLPFFEWVKQMGELTDEQFEEYTNKNSIYESIGPMYSNEIGYTTKEELKNHGFIDLNTAINNLKNEFGIK